MNTADPLSERAIIERIAQEYRDKGYDVVVQPDVTERPDFLREYHPDIIAKSPKESVVVQVRHVSSPQDAASLKTLAQRVESRSDWKFVFVAAAGSANGTEAALVSLDASQIGSVLGQARDLRRQNQLRAALLIAWSALEAAMRRVVISNDLSIARPDSLGLLRELASNGLIERDRYRDLMEGLRLRSALTHGFEIPSNTDVIQVLDMVEATTNELVSSQAQVD